MGSIHHHDIDPGLHQRFDTFISVRAGADAGANPQLTQRIFARIGIRLSFGNVFNRDHAGKFERVVYQQHFLNSMVVQYAGNLFETGAFRRGHQPVFGCHDILDQGVITRFKTYISAGDDTQQLIPPHHRHAGNAILQRRLIQLLNGRIRVDGHRVANNSSLKFFHCTHFTSLLLRCHVFMHDTNAAFLCQSYSQAPFGHGIHGR